jgi:hypothetical protein
MVVKPTMNVYFDRAPHALEIRDHVPTHHALTSVEVARSPGVQQARHIVLRGPYRMAADCPILAETIARQATMSKNASTSRVTQRRALSVEACHLSQDAGVSR